MALPRAAPPNWPDVVCRSTTNCSALENAKVKRKETTKGIANPGLGSQGARIWVGAGVG